MNISIPASRARLKILDRPKSYSPSVRIGSQIMTMTTLGYGDIVPISPIARALVYTQAVFGQFYIAILVAGLVSAYISNRDAN